MGDGTQDSHVCLDDVLITDELSRRPTRDADHKAEAQALNALAHRLAGEPRDMLKELAAIALHLCRAGTAGISLLEAAPGPKAVFRWVDDHRDASESLATLLRFWGHHVDVAHDGTSALSAARASAPDVVLLDIGLPDMDGHEVARRLRREKGMAQVRLVALTGYGRAEDFHLSQESGFDQHMLKPVDLDTLCGLLGQFGQEGAGGGRLPEDTIPSR